MPSLLTVAEVNATIRRLIDDAPVLQDLWVTGEVSNVTLARSGHWYFTVKDADAQLRCVMWRSDTQRQVIQPEEGEAIKVHGSIGVYEQRGEYQLYADEIQPAGGVGDLYRRFEALKQQLADEGLFDAGRKQALPPFPLRIGVVTSPNAAAFRDIQNVLARRFPLARVVLSPTLVQGTTAAPQIVEALQRLNTHRAVDVILLSRGGGSIEDLWCFNDERVARAVVASEIPVISGVGHETDFTIVDFVADVRAPTPSAAAEVAVPSRDDLRVALQRIDESLLRHADDTLRGQRLAIDNAQQTLRRLSPERTVQEMRQRVDEWQGRLVNAQARHLALLQERLNVRVKALETANPAALLERGYAMLSREDGTPVLRAADAPTGTDLRVRLRDGTLHTTVNERDLHDDDTP